MNNSHIMMSSQRNQGANQANRSTGLSRGTGERSTTTRPIQFQQTSSHRHNGVTTTTNQSYYKTGSTSLTGTSAGAKGKVAWSHMDTRTGSSNDVGYAKAEAKVGGLPTLKYPKGPHAQVGGKVGMVKVRENIGGWLNVRAEGPYAGASATGDANVWKGSLQGKAKADAGLAKVIISSGPVGLKLGLSADCDASGSLWPPQAGVHVLGTGASIGWNKAEFSVLGNGVTVKNPIAYYYGSD